MKIQMEKLLLAVAMSAMSPMVLAGVVVIANPAIKTDALSADQIAKIYMGRLTELPDGARITPVDQAEGAEVRVQFLERVLGKNEQQFRSHWTRMVFTGKGQPPRSVIDDAGVVRAVAAGADVVGFVDSKAVSPKVKVLYRAD